MSPSLTVRVSEHGRLPSVPMASHLDLFGNTHDGVGAEVGDSVGEFVGAAVGLVVGAPVVGD